MRVIIFNTAKINKPSVKKETSYVLSSRIVLNDWKTIYVFKLERKKMLLCEIYNMKNLLKQVNLVSSIIITKNKLIKIFILNILYLWYTENAERESKNINDICWVDNEELTKKIWFERIGLWWILLSLAGLLWQTLPPQIDLLGRT